MPEWIGKTIGKVRIEKYLARGGMAEVYLGTHLTLERQVAVKVMHSYIEEDPDLLTRFQREAKVVAGLRHPNIVQIFDFDTAEGHPYIVMEYLRGPSLASYLRDLHGQNQRIPVRHVARFLKSLASALDYAHGQGVVHRDIKPGNVILHSTTDEIPPDGTLTDNVDAVLTDFGLVRIAHSATQTASGLVSGTPAYMSPEQARGDKVDFRSDIYSLGVVLYEMLAGRVPFEGDSTIAVIYKHINEPPPPISGIAAPVQAIIERALAKEPDQRYQSAIEMTADFYQAINLNADANTLVTSLPRTSRQAPVSGKRNPLQGPVLIGGIVVAAVFASILFFGKFGIPASSQSISMSPQVSPPAVTQAYIKDQASPMPMGSSNPFGDLHFQDGTSALDQVIVSAKLAAPANGTQYQAWLISDSGEQRKNLGVLKPDASGQFTTSYIDPQGRNLLDGFSHMEITVEPNPDDSPNPSGQVAYSSAIPMGALIHIRHLLVMMEDNPSHIGMTVGLVNDTTLIKKSADAMAEASKAGNTKNVQADAETIINLIVGKQDPNSYKDWNGDGKISDPGDGYGLLLNGDQAGYIGGTIDHAKLAAASSDSTPDIRLHSGHVVICAQNVEMWATQLRDIAIRIAEAQSNQNEEADIHSAITLANQMLNGVDINGNETIDPIPGEGGAITAYDHSDFMATMPIMQGKDQVPPTGK